MNELRHLVEDTDHETLQNFVVGLLSEDENLVMRLRLLSNNELTEEDFDQYKKMYQNIVKRNVEKGSFVPYSKARRMERSLNDFLNDEVTGLVSNKYFEEAFDITKLIFLRINKLRIEDGHSVVSEIMDEIFRVWQAILNNGPKSISVSMFRWIISRRGSLGDATDTDKYLEFLLDNFREPNQMERKLQIAGQKIETLNIEDEPDKAELGKWADFYLGLAGQMDDEETIEAFIGNYLELSEVRQYAIEKHISNAEYEAAIELLEEGRALPRKPHGLNKHYTIQLKELYKIKKDRAAYIEALWLLVTRYDVNNLEFFNELKMAYSEEEWPEKRAEIFKAMPEYARLGDYYRSEGMEV